MIRILVLFFFSSAFADTPGVSLDFSRVGDATHLELKGPSNWRYEAKRLQSGNQKNQVLLRVPKLRADALVRLRSYQDAVIAGIEVNENGIDDSHEITFTLKSDQIDYFDYQTEKPSKLVVDFFVKTEASQTAGNESDADTAPALSNSDIPKSLPAKKTGKSDRIAIIPNEQDGKKTDKRGLSRLPASKTENVVALKQVSKDPSQRKPAGEFIQIEGIPALPAEFTRGIFDGGDPTFRRFSVEDFEIKDSALIRSSGNIYIRFPMLRLDSPHLQTLLANPPIYEIIPKETAENKEARLLLTLFQNQRRGVFLKTAKQFLKKYPDSEYDEIVRYMLADIHYGLWQTEKSTTDFETAMGLYRALTELYPDSPLATRTMLLLGYSYLHRGDYIAALKSLERFLRVRSDSPSCDQVRVSIAEAYLGLNKYEEAYNQLDEVSKRTPATAEARRDALEATYRKGDIFFQKKDYENSIVEYKNALKKFGDDWRGFPNAYFNVAEAEFWKGRYKDSLKSYRDYLQRFPSHDFGGYAMTRIGELLEILGADEKKTVGSYLEAIFRYQGTPGAGVARMRLLSQRMASMKDKELRQAIKEIDAVVASSDLTDIQEFATFIKADGYFNRGEFNTATQLLIDFYQKNPNSVNNEKFQSRIVRSITEDIRTDIANGKFIDALKTYGRYADTWLKRSERIDTRYYVGQAYEQAGVISEAGNVYRESLNNLYSIVGTPKEKERNVFEILPKADSLNLRLAAIAAKEKNYIQAQDYLKQIKAPNDLSEAEQIERAEIWVDVAGARGQNDVAKKFLGDLLKAWKGQPVSVAPLLLRLAKIQKQSGERDAAETSVAKILLLQKDTGLISEDIHAQAMEMQADLLLARGDKSQAVATYRDLLDTYEGKRPLAPLRYKTGNLLFESGDIKAAEDVWAQLKEEKTGIWHKLAQEQLQGAKWRGDYKRYIERIPAMAPEDSAASNTKPQTDEAGSPSSEEKGE